MTFRPIAWSALTLALAAGAACRAPATAEAPDAPSAPVAPATPVTETTACTPVASGAVTLDEETLPDFLSDNLDEAVALRITVARPTPAQEEAGSLADLNDDRLVLSYSAGLGEGGWEMLAPAGAYRTEGSGWAVDGMFVVRSGGMHQGIISYALETPATPAAPACATGVTL